MTVPRVVLLLCAALALLDGAIWEAVGIAAFAGVLLVMVPPTRRARVRGTIYIR